MKKPEGKVALDERTSPIPTWLSGSRPRSARRSRRLETVYLVGTMRRLRLSGYPFKSVRSARKLGVFYAGIQL
jgi:hypothetical protein